MLSALLLISCKPTVPGRYIQPDDMEDLLYDYHLAMATAAAEYRQSIDIRQLQEQYRKKVFEQHGITQAEFDESMVYYYRHADRLNNIYKNLSQRFSDDGEALGVSITPHGSQIPTTGDTANVWRGDNTHVLLPYKPHNIYSFRINADTAFHAGDQLSLNFNAVFIYQDGPRDATAYLVVRYNNDSIATQMRRITSSTRYSMFVTDAHKVGIKEVSGYFIMPHSLAELSSNSFRIVSLYDIHMVKTRAGSKPATIEKGDAETVTPSTDQPVNTQQAQEGMGEEEVFSDDMPGNERSKPHRAQGNNSWKIANPHSQRSAIKERQRDQAPGHNAIDDRNTPQRVPPPDNTAVKSVAPDRNR